MKTFKELKQELIEASKKSSKRQEQKHESGLSSAMISAHRGDLTDTQNKKRHKDLKKLVTKSGHGHVEIIGRYKERDDKTGKERQVTERSLRIDAKGKEKKHHTELKSLAKALGRRYNQDSVAVVSKKRGSALHGLKKDGWPKKGKKVPVGDMHRDPKQGEEYASYMAARPKKGFIFKK
tara:strand:+ start:1764 stop:2300 length:537 start_codon:yes stop_codon:yes gene_type:complete